MAKIIKHENLHMYSKKHIGLLIVSVVMTTSLVSCGLKKDEANIGDAVTYKDQSTSQAVTQCPTDKQQDMDKIASQIASEKASVEELSKKAVEEAVRKAEEAESIVREKASKKRELETQAATIKEELEIKAEDEKESILSGQNAQTDQNISSKSNNSDRIVTVVDSYGVESAREQYNANYSEYMELIRLTNELRASLGIPALAVDENICIASCKKAIDYYLADFYDGVNHKMIDGRAWQSIYQDFNIKATAKAENLARGAIFNSAEAMFEGWKNSPVHYQNLVDPDFTRVGVGSCGYVWFMNFAN